MVSQRLPDRIRDDELQELVDRAKRAANVIYTVVPEPVADDLSCILRKLLAHTAAQQLEMQRTTPIDTYTAYGVIRT